MQGPRSPEINELPRVIEFLNSKLRTGSDWSIASEYPTALTPSNVHNMKIISDAEQILSHAVIKPIVVKAPHVILKVAAIGSVVTDPNHRNKGLSTQIMNECILEATRQQADIAILWTDQFDFYRRIGFELAGSETSINIQGALVKNDGELRFSSDSKVSPESIYRLYNQHTVGAARTAEDIRKFMNIPKTKIYTAWGKDGQLAAYAVEGKGADLGGYIHEWGGSVSKLVSLLSWISSQRKESLTLISPFHSQNLIQTMIRYGCTVHEGYLGMIKILELQGLAYKLKRAFGNIGVHHFVLEESAGTYQIGLGTDIFQTQNISDIIHLLFGPIDLPNSDILSEQTTQTLSRLLPLPLWLWGWDSI